MAKMDPMTQKQIVDQITAQITASFQLQEQEQIQKVQAELDKLRELLGKKNHESGRKDENDDSSKTSKNYNKASFDCGG